MKHGPIALIDKNMPGSLYCHFKMIFTKKTLSNIEEVRARDGQIIAIATEGDKNYSKVLRIKVIYIPQTLPMFTPALAVIPLQLLSYLHCRGIRQKT